MLGIDRCLVPFDTAARHVSSKLLAVAFKIPKTGKQSKVSHCSLAHIKTVNFLILYSSFNLFDRICQTSVQQQFNCLWSML